MSYQSLGAFVARLEAEGELMRIRQTVSPVLEITELADRMSKTAGGGKALFFEKVEGSDFPVLINAFGSMKRISLALQATPDELAERFRQILDQAPPKNIFDKLRMIPKALSWSRFLPRTSTLATPPCQQTVIRADAVDLSRLPILHCWPKDGGRFVTLPVVFTKGLTDGKPNAGMYRMQIYDRNTTGMHWHIHKDGAHHYHEYQKTHTRMPVAVAIGTDPAVTYAATAPMPRGVDEMILAGFIRQKPVTMTKAVTVDIEVPAEAEFVLEGYVDPDERRVEGPFGDHTGYYSLEDEYPVFHVTAITHRNNPVYSATVVGKPPMEDCYLALVTERLFLPMIRTILPEIIDYWLPWEGVFHNIAVVAIEKEFAGHATKVMNALWGTGQMSFAKVIVAVDDRKLLSDGGALLRQLLDTVDLTSDIIITEGILDVLDHSAPQPLRGSKVGIDGTARAAGEQPRKRRKRARISNDQSAVLARLKAIDGGFTAVRVVFDDSANPLILIAVAKQESRSSQSFIDCIPEGFGHLGIILLFDESINLEDNSLVLWRLFNNVDPGRDIRISDAMLLIDATRKGEADGHTRPWPDDIEMTEAVRSLVDSKFGDLRDSSRKTST